MPARENTSCCEKPLASNTSDAADMVKAARDANVVLGALLGTGHQRFA